MTYEQLKDLKPGDFKRARGVSSQPSESTSKGKIKTGRPPKFPLEDQLLMTLQYWREYHTYFHTGLSWGVAESVVCRTVQRTENFLIKSHAFHVPGKKKLREEGT
jgi:hypothetical protein